MAEMHPILWSRITDRRLSKQGCQVSRCCRPSASFLRARRQPMIFVPQTDLAILNYICNYIIQNGKQNKASSSATSSSRSARPTSVSPAPEPCAGSQGHEQRLPGAEGKPKGDTGAGDISFDEFGVRGPPGVEAFGALEDRTVKMAELCADLNRSRQVSFRDHGLACAAPAAPG